MPNPFRTACLALLAGLPLGGMPAGAAPQQPSKPPAAPAPVAVGRIAATVNGDVITEADVANRARLFAVATGLPLSGDVIERLKPQILRQLIDERLRVQEAQRRKIVIGDAQIAGTIKDIEERNRMQPGALRARLAANGVSARTLIDQIRAQIAWSQMLREAVSEKVNITEAEVAEQQRLAAQRVGQPEYRMGEIFIPIDDPANGADAQRFAETVISELRAGAPFAMVAAQFSQNQSALEGGDTGWVQASQLDPEIARLAAVMPIGAVSNPVRVPGGLSVVTLAARREVGRDMATVASLRQAFFAFAVPLTDPQNPTDQQRQALAKAQAASASIRTCEAMEAAAKAANPPERPANPGEVRLDAVNPPMFRQLLMSLPLGKPTEPLVQRDGIAVVAVCSREQKNVGELTAGETQRRLMNERVESLSRQMMRDLHRKANIETRDKGV
jgi:peptidyl-prolyl cis-trans isomerase SurA